MEIRFKKLNSHAKVPTRGSDCAAGWDLYACLESNSITIPAHETVKIGTGIATELPKGTFGAIFSRSGIATKQGLRPANCVGVIDSDYRGEYIVALHNDTDTPKTILNEARIAQLVLLPFLSMEFVEVEELNDTQRGEGGFASTGN